MRARPGALSALSVALVVAGVAGVEVRSSQAQSSLATRELARSDELVAVVGENWCGPEVAVTVRGPRPDLFEGDRVGLQRLIGGLRAILPFECPSFRTLRISGEVGGTTVYRGTADESGRLAHLPVESAPQIAAPPAAFDPGAITPRPTESLVPRNQDRDMVADAQRRLNALGFDAGTVDGLYGQRTRAAIAAFERRHGQAETGNVSERLIAELRRAAGEAPPATLAVPAPGFPALAPPTAGDPAAMIAAARAPDYDTLLAHRLAASPDLVEDDVFLGNYMYHRAANDTQACNALVEALANEFAWRQYVERHRPVLRQALEAARQLPEPVFRATDTLNLGEYDFDREGFPVMGSLRFDLSVSPGANQCRRASASHPRINSPRLPNRFHYTVDSGGIAIDFVPMSFAEAERFTLDGEQRRRAAGHPRRIEVETVVGLAGRTSEGFDERRVLRVTLTDPLDGRVLRVLEPRAPDVGAEAAVAAGPGWAVERFGDARPFELEHAWPLVLTRSPGLADDDNFALWYAARERCEEARRAQGDEFARADFSRAARARLQEVIADARTRSHPTHFVARGTMEFGDYDAAREAFPLRVPRRGELSLRAHLLMNQADLPPFDRPHCHLGSAGWGVGHALEARVTWPFGDEAVLTMDEAEARAFIEPRRGDRGVDRAVEIEFVFAAEPVPALGDAWTGPVLAARVVDQHSGRVLAFLEHRDEPEPSVAERRDPAEIAVPESEIATGPFLLATYFARAGLPPGRVDDVIAQDHRFRSVDEFRRGAVMAEAREAFAAEIERVREAGAFWLGGRITFGEYDFTAGGMSVTRVATSYRQLSHDQLPLASAVPRLELADPDALSPLPMSDREAQTLLRTLLAPETRGWSDEAFFAALESGRGPDGQYVDLRRFRDNRVFEARLRVEPVDVGEPRRRGDPVGALVLHVHELQLLDPHNATRVVHRARLTDPDGEDDIAAAIWLAETPPALPDGATALPLDAETLDLMVARHRPDLLDDAMVERMLIARWRYEQRAEAPLFGRFFRQGGREPDEVARRAIAPAFVEWTRARAEAMPPRLVLAGTVSRWRGGHRWLATGGGRFMCVVAPAWTPALGDRFGDQASFEAAMGSEERFAIDALGAQWYGLRHRTIDAGMTRCEGNDSTLLSTREDRRDLAATSDYLRIADGLPAPPAEIDYGQKFAEIELTVEDVAVESASDGSRAIVFDTRLIEARLHEPNTPETIVATLRPDGVAGDSDAAPVADAEVAPPDILGITLGMSFAEAERLIAESMEIGKLLVADRAREVGYATGTIEPFTSGRLYVSADGRDLIVLYDDPPAAQGVVVGVARQILLPKGRATPAAVMASLRGKYGPEDVVVSGMMSTDMLVWGEPDAFDRTRNPSYQNCLPGRIDHRGRGDMWRDEDGTPADWGEDGLRVNGGFPALQPYNFGGGGQFGAGHAGCGIGVAGLLEQGSERAQWDGLYVWLFDLGAYAETINESARLLREGGREDDVPALDVRL